MLATLKRTEYWESIGDAKRHHKAGNMARADGTGSPQQILIAPLGYQVTGKQDVQPSLPRGTASVVDKTSTWEYWDFIAWGTEKHTGILWGAGIQTKQNKSFSLREPTAHTQVSDTSPWDTPTPQLP